MKYTIETAGRADWDSESFARGRNRLSHHSWSSPVVRSLIHIAQSTVLLGQRSDKRQQVLQLLRIQFVAKRRHDARLAVGFAALGNHRNNEAVGQPLIAFLVSPIVGRHCRLKLHQVGSVAFGSAAVTPGAIGSENLRTTVRTAFGGSRTDRRRYSYRDHCPNCFFDSRDWNRSIHCPPAAREALRA